jgi:hypothetical protein
MLAVRAGLDSATGLARVPPGIRNGSWDYATLDPASGRIGSVNNADCHACHARAEAWQYTFSYPPARTGSPDWPAAARRLRPVRSPAVRGLRALIAAPGFSLTPALPPRSQWELNCEHSTPGCSPALTNQSRLEASLKRPARFSGLGD